MDQPKTARLARLNAYQVAGLAIVSSAVAAGAVLLLMRRFVFRPQSRQETLPTGEPEVQPAVETSAPTETPHHFSENLIVPGKTATGTEISEQDARDGRSPEGV